MLHLLVPLLLQGSAQHRMLAAEDARAQDVSVFMAAIRGSDENLQRLAVRAIGRLERPALSDSVLPLLRSPSAAVRRETVNALSQMGAAYPFAFQLTSERDPSVHAVIYEALGRATPVVEGTERVLVDGLAAPDLGARTGAVRGIEALFRRNARAMRPSDATLAALRRAFRDNASAELRELALLALNATRDRDSAVLALALRDTSAQVRRLGVLALPQWIDDPSPMVRYEAMRLAATCDRAAAGTNDASELVALAAVDALAARRCDPGALLRVLAGKTPSWRMRAHAVVSLARVAPDSARRHIAALARDGVWQARVYAATAAKLAKDSATLVTLAHDAQPNVAAEALTTIDDAVRALASDHAGLLLAAARRLRGAPELPRLLPQVVAALDRITRGGRATMHDPRVQLLERVRDAGDSATFAHLRSYLADFDPAIAALAAEIISQKTNTHVAPQTTRYTGTPIPSEQELHSLDGATARIVMKGLGAFTIELLTDDAPVTVAAFARLAERGQFNGLTFHRMVPNFVIQGGSPGADEYDGATREFLRDELGLLSHRRGTLGISTRGRDTGDGQIFVNLVDNFRLDHDYTVFARTLSGMDVVDRILEGDVIESVTIVRKR